MKKLIVGFAAVGVVMALRRRVAQKMRDHCKEMMEGRSETTDHEARAHTMPAHCEGMAAQHREDEPVVAA